jgi:MFS transporter, ACS family, hexuronate transporter
VDAQGLGGTGARMGFFAMLGVRNILLCCLISIVMVSWFIMGWTFLPKFFTDYRHLSPTVMSYLMTSLGVASAFSSFTVPALSDRFGRKPVMIAFCFVGVLTPLAALFIQGPPVLIGALMFVGWFGAGTFPLYMGVIPGETISRRYAATAMGLVVCVGEVVGGFGITLLTGALADVWSITTEVLVQAACAVAGGLLCLFLVETAPARVSAASRHRVSADALRREVS